MVIVVVTADGRLIHVDPMMKGGPRDDQVGYKLPKQVNAMGCGKQSHLEKHPPGMLTEWQLQQTHGPHYAVLVV